MDKIDISSSQQVARRVSHFLFKAVGHFPMIDSFPVYPWVIQTNRNQKVNRREGRVFGRRATEQRASYKSKRQSFFDSLK
tara:strand:- start:307 stop:546 length:240 start_codon:yes stop_codon:yes gene_type:complete